MEIPPPKKSPLIASEAEIFAKEFDLLTDVFHANAQGQRIRTLFDRNKAIIREAVEMAKAEFSGGFNGIDSQSGFGWQLLRPEHLRRFTTDTGVTNQNWRRTIATPGFNDWIGTSTTSNQINRRAMLVILGIVNHEPIPKSTALLLTINGITYPPWPFHFAMKAQGGLKVWGIPKPKTLSPLTNVYFRLFDEDTGEDEPQVVGVTFAESGYLQLQAPALESP